MENNLTFLGIGAQKTATTWLNNMIEQHPQISMPRNKKEIHFFNKVENFRKGLKWYKSHFNWAVNIKAVGEITPNYFWTSPYSEKDREGTKLQNEKIPALVYNALGDIKFIVCLRDPVDRAVSSYFHQIRAGNIKPTESILEVSRYHGIESMGYYDIHFTNWLKYFSLDNFLILFYETDIHDDIRKGRTLARIFQHIGVDARFKPVELTSKFNARKTDFEMHLNHFPIPGFIKRRITRYTPSFIKESNKWKLAVSQRDRDILRKRFAKHNEALEKIIHLKLPWNLSSD